jgi:VRR-NUC domain
VSESQLVAQILLETSRGPTTRLFRLNAGQAWSGTITERTARKLVLLDYHPVKLAPEGFSDIAGWTTVDQRAIFTAIEAKFGRNRATAPQLSFIDAVVKAGGRAGVAYSLEDARKIIAGL